MTSGISDRLSQPSASAGDCVDEYDTVGAARYLGCTPGHLKNLRATGEGPEFTRLFRRKGIRYERSELVRWKQSRRYGSTTEYPENLP